MRPETLAAVLVDPDPELWVQGESEAEVLEKLAAVGPLPQADLFEPWEEGEPWQARARVPDTDPGRCLAVGELRHGHPAGRQEWLDVGRIGEEEIRLGDAAAVCWFDHHGDVLTPELRELEAPIAPQVAEAFARAVAGAPHWIEAVAHRESGRPGVRFTVQVPDLEPEAERRAVLEAVLTCGEPLAPELQWWFELGRLVFVGWRVAPVLQARPGDGGFGWTTPLRGWHGRIELQVAFEPAAHDADALRLAEALGPHGFMGSRPRWIGDRFVACWELELEDRDAALPATEKLLRSAIRGLPGNPPWRLVPGCPQGLEARWQGVDPRWWPGLVRYRCGLLDRDLLPALQPREADEVDRELITRLGMLGLPDPVQADVPALRLVLPTLSAPAWTAWVERFGALQHPQLAAVHYVAMGERLTVLIRRQGPVTDSGWVRAG